MTYREIKAQLALKGIKSVDIAAAAGCSRGAVSQVVSGKRGSPRIRKAIAAKLGMPVGKLWPPAE
jgi:lambda repressor-like predicted transcriptional regulator